MAVVSRPALGHRPLTITRADVEELVHDATSSWRAHHVVKVLRMTLGRAVRAGKIAVNPASGIELRGSSGANRGRYPLRSWIGSSRRCRTVGEPSFSSPHTPRSRSQLVGLRVGRLELPRNRIRVEGKITEAGHLIAGVPKTERSRRTVMLPDFVTFELAEHLRRYPPGA